MDIKFLIIAIPFTILAFILFSMYFGRVIRQRTEGYRFYKDQGIKSNLKTFIIGLVIVIGLTTFILISKR